MVRFLDSKELRDAVLKELVSLDDRVGSISAQPVLVAIAEGDWEGQVGITKAIGLSEAMVGVAAELKRGRNGPLCAARPQLKLCRVVAADDLHMM